jgi:HTH-type transcriptional regulator / antitoxin HigA
MTIPVNKPNDVELAAYTNALFQLTALENPSRSELEAIELLTFRLYVQ